MFQRIALVTIFLLVFAASGPGQNPEVIDRLIQKLGAKKAETRESAAKRLENIGAAALPALREAAKTDTNPEVRLRAGQLVKTIGRFLFPEIRRFAVHQGTNPILGLWITRLAVSPDGRRVVSCGGDGLRLWDTASGKMLLHFGKESQRGYWAAAFSQDGRRLIAGGDDNLARVWDMPSGALVQTLKGHTGSVWGAALSKDGRLAVTGGWDQKLRLWDVETGKPIREFLGNREKIRCLALSADGKWLAAGHFATENAPSTLRLWDTDSGKEIRSFHGHQAEITSVAFSADAKKLLSSSFDKTVRLWDVGSGRELQRFRGHAGRVEWASFTADSKQVISGADQDDRTVRIWDAANGRQIYCSEPVGKGFLCVAPLPDGCLTSGKDGVVWLWQWK